MQDDEEASGVQPGTSARAPGSTSSLDAAAQQRSHGLGGGSDLHVKTSSSSATTTTSISAAARGSSTGPTGGVISSIPCAGVLTSSLSFLSTLASLDKLTPILGLGTVGGAGGDAFPRGQAQGRSSVNREDAVGSSEHQEDEDLRLEEATADGETFQDQLSPPSTSTPSFASLPFRSPDLSFNPTKSPLSPRSASTAPTDSLTFTSSSSSSTTNASTSTESHGPTGSRAALFPPQNAGDLDPLTFHTVSRKSSAADAVRLSRERAYRIKELDFQNRLAEQAAQAQARPRVLSRPLGTEPKSVDQPANGHQQRPSTASTVVPSTFQAPAQSGVESSTSSPRKESLRQQDARANPASQTLPAAQHRQATLEKLESRDTTDPTVESESLDLVHRNEKASTSAPPDVVTDDKKPRRRSIFARLGFSPSSKSRSSVSGSPSAKIDLQPVPANNRFSSRDTSYATDRQLQGPGPTVGHASASSSSLGQYQLAQKLTSGATQREPGESGSLERSENTTSTIPKSGANNAAASCRGSNPTAPRKAKYIKTKLKNKTRREFEHLFLAQELLHHDSSARTPEQAALTSGSLAKASSVPATAATVKSSMVSTPSANAVPTSSQARSTPSKTIPSVMNKPKRAVWAMKFSPDGKYMASAGADGVVKVWLVISSREERSTACPLSEATSSPVEEIAQSPASSAHTQDPSFGQGLSSSPPSTTRSRSSKRASRMSQSSVTSGATGTGSGRSASASQSTPPLPPVPVFCPVPVQEWKGHTADVLDLNWSKNNFLLSSSMDKTVRLWHVSRKECLCAFQHPDFVTSIAFHPKDDRYFLSGSLDSKLRLWSIPDKQVHCWTQLPELITCVSFTSDGKYAIAGTFVALCLFFNVQDLSFVAKLHSKSARGKNSKGRKITSIVPIPKGEPSEPERLLVTSNDSRMRLWNVSCLYPNAPQPASNSSQTTAQQPQQTQQSQARIPRIIHEKNLEAKYKSHENASSQIKATFSDDGRYIISGSEDRQVYIWQSGLLDFPHPFAQTSKKGADKSPGCESFSLGSTTSASSSSSNAPNGSSFACPSHAVTSSNTPTVFPATPASATTSFSKAQQSGVNEVLHSLPAPGIVTCAIFAPAEARAELARSGDPLYNEDWSTTLAEGDPNDEMESLHSASGSNSGSQPVLRRSMSASSAASSTAYSQGSHYNPFNNAAHSASVARSGSRENGQGVTSTLPPAASENDNHSIHSATSSTSEGAIIVTADDQSGVIRVYRNHRLPTLLNVVRSKRSASNSSSATANGGGGAGQHHLAAIPPSIAAGAGNGTISAIAVSDQLPTASSRRLSIASRSGAKATATTTTSLFPTRTKEEAV